MRLQDKVVVVTGAASGIGLAIARLFTAEGASVVAGDWNGARLDEAVKSIAEAGGTITGLQGDISDKASAEALVDLAVETYGKLDVLVNNAGIMDVAAPVGDLDDETWRKVLAVNLDGPMFTSRRAVEIMLPQGRGSIVNIASIAGIGGASGGAAYTSSKHGVLGLTKSTAWMYAKRGIRCNAVLPGFTDTNIGESMPPDKVNAEGMARVGEHVALCPQHLSPLDIAYAALYFASDESARITGAWLTADGGWMSA